MDARWFVRLFVGVAALFVVSPAMAAYVDFRAIGGPDNAPTWSGVADGVTITVTPGPNSSARLYWDSTDGFGVRGSGYETDEIEGKETLTVAFSQPVSLASLNITDLFKENGYREKGYYSVDGGAAQQFLAATSQLLGSTNGVLTVAVNTMATVLTLTAPGKIGNQHHDFSLGGLSFTAVPELSAGGAAMALALVIGGMFVLGGRRRRVQVRI